MVDIRVEVFIYIHTYLHAYIFTCLHVYVQILKENEKVRHNILQAIIMPCAIQIILVTGINLINTNKSRGKILKSKCIIS